MRDTAATTSGGLPDGDEDLWSTDYLDLVALA